MNVLYFIGSIILLDLTSALLLIPPFEQNPPLIPGCPVQNYYEPCYDPCFDENGNEICSNEGKICCLNQCGYPYCAYPDFVDGCAPFVEGIDVCLPDCYDPCTGIPYCDEFEYCCYSYYCGYYCSIPTLNAVCPDSSTDPDAFCEPCRDKFGKDICTDGELCCYGPCGEKCTQPDYYRVLCPNESILEEPEQYLKMTSFCIENCDCSYNGQICCESPCGCELDICRNPVIQKAECPDYCSYYYSDYYYSDCTTDDYCYQNGQICCDSCYDDKVCVDPVFVDGPSNLYEIGNPDIP